ncbi:TrkA C-terminal domain-containing protein [Alienimonas californiensis]|uniref:TrkA-C domain protein n=1 Tax=Alienimonas californiensis TaxID=2527989 RepID=A0A517PFJ6_9PLAN|nr:TrkA C-terminal domain-containing protein [Alienimonas californiensis]QDT18135.1 TrkA-C domain protein [Alienimonas californiensis]
MAAAFLSLLATLAISLVVTRVATVAFMATGMSRESARFQARSTFTGVGYATHEAESVMNHPVRRRIAMILMLLGNLGVATVAGTVMLSVASINDAARPGDENYDPWAIWKAVGLFIAGTLTLIWLANSEWVERRLNRIISRALRKYTSLNVQDYVALLHLAQGYVISELRVEPEDWLANKTLIQLALPQEGVLVLGVQRKGGAYVGAPHGETLIRPYDTLLVYANGNRVEELDSRPAGRAGDEEHAAAVAAQGRVEAKEDAEERVAA